MAETGLPQHLLAPAISYSKAYFNLSEDSFVYFCPQSVFKIHPLFDFVLRDILLANPMGHIVVTEGRRPRWTEAYAERLRRSLGDVLMRRLHLIERVSAEKFMSLLRIADVMLHPFPFDGSRTSADGFAAGIPVLTMPTGMYDTFMKDTVLCRYGHPLYHLVEVKYHEISSSVRPITSYSPFPSLLVLQLSAYQASVEEIATL